MYDPSAGNLLLDVVSLDASQTFGVFTHFDAHIFQGVVIGPPIFIGSFGDLSSRAYSADPNAEASLSWGLVTGFNDNSPLPPPPPPPPPSPVPEPSALFLFLTGLGGLCTVRRRLIVRV